MSETIHGSNLPVARTSFVHKAQSSIHSAMSGWYLGGRTPLGNDDCNSKRPGVFASIGKNRYRIMSRFKFFTKVTVFCNAALAVLEILNLVQNSEISRPTLEPAN